jgi:WD40 repeat protein
LLKKVLSVDLVALRLIRLNQNRIDSVSFLKQCDKLKNLKILDIANNNLKELTNTDKTHLTHVCFDETNGVEDISIISLLDANKCLMYPIKTLDKHHGGSTITCLQYDTESKTLFSGGYDRSLKIIKFKDNQMNDYDLLKSLDNHHGGFVISCLQYDAESKTLFSGGYRWKYKNNKIQRQSNE